MGIAIKKLFAQLLFWIYDFLDLLGDIFRVLAGLDPITVNNEGTSSDMTLLDAFMHHTLFSKVIFGLIIVGAVIAMACGIVRTVKNVIVIKAGGEPRSHAVTVGQTFFAILASVGCVFFVLMFIGFSNVLLQCVDKVTAVDGNTSLSQQLFDMSVEWSYEVDYDNPEDAYVIKTDEYGNPVFKTDSEGNYIYETDASGNYVDKNKEPLPPNAPIEERVPVYEMEWTYYYPYSSELSSGYYNGHDITDVDFTHGVDYVFGVHGRLFGFEYEQYAYTKEPIVRLESFNIFTAYLVAVVMLVSIIMTCFALGKRLFDIVVLLFMMPLICGTIPLDDGARFKSWRETLMSKVFLVFGAVLAMNVFFQATSVISQIDFSSISSNGLTQNIVKMFIYMCGALCINTSQVLVARVLGTSADESRELAQAGRTIMSGVALGVGGIVGAKNMVFGGTNRYGRVRQGLFGTVRRAVQGAGALGGSSSGGTGGYVGSLGRYAGTISSRDPITIRNALSGSLNGRQNTLSNMSPRNISDKNSLIPKASNVQTNLPKTGLKSGKSKPFRDNTKKK